MPSFNKAFGTCHIAANPATGALEEQCSLSARRQSITGIGVLFQAVGGAAAGVTGAYIGRRTAIQLACSICIIDGAGMLGTAGSFLNYMVCKSIACFGLGHLQAVAIVYGAECTPPNRRGLLLGVFNIGLALGNVAAVAVAAGSSHLAPTDDWQWKAPIMCQIPLNLILGAGVLMFPESPRWLAVQNRENKARPSVARFQKEEPQAPIVTAQIEDSHRHIDLERQIAATTSWTEIYRGRNLPGHPEYLEHVIVHEAPTTILLDDATYHLNRAFMLLDTYAKDGVQEAFDSFRTEMKGYRPGNEALSRLGEADGRNFWENEFLTFTIYCPDLTKVVPNGVSIAVAAGRKSADAFYARTTLRQSEIMECPRYMVPGHHNGYESQPLEFAHELKDILDKLNSSKKRW